MSPDRTLTGIATRSALLGVVVSLVTVPVYVYVEPSWRPLVARVAAALVLGVALVQLRRLLVDHIERAGASALDEARRRRGPEPVVPHHVLDLRRDVRAALRSRRYFEDVLWPRLMAFTSEPLVRPSSRRGRGPSLAVLRAVIARIEERP